MKKYLILLFCILTFNIYSQNYKPFTKQKCISYSIEWECKLKHFHTILGWDFWLDSTKPNPWPFKSGEPTWSPRLAIGVIINKK